MIDYPRTPDGWTVTDRRRAGPFTTHVSYRRPDGTTAEWSSRLHRKHASLLSRRRGSSRWAPRSAAWWIGVLFAIGSACFIVGPFPGFLSLVGPEADAIVFFGGSIFFTAAALLQYLEAANADEGPGRRRRRLRLLTFEPRRIDWWSSLIQLAGTVFFNLSTYRSLEDAIGSGATDQLIWRPDMLGSICFLVAGYLAYVEASGSLGWRRRPERGWRIAVVNLAGCVAFQISAVASYTLPKTGDVLALGAANFTTAAGALCFLIGALWLLPESVE